MSNQMSEKRKRDEENRLSAGHLGQTDARQDEDEDWDVAPATASTTSNIHHQEDEDEDLADEDLERELSEDDEDDLEEDDDDDDFEEENEVNTREAPVASAVEQKTVPALANVNTEEALKQIEALQGNLPAFEAALNNKLAEINVKRKQLDTEEAEVKSRMNLLRVLGGKPPLDDEEELPARPRRGRKPRSATDPTTPVTPVATTEGGEPVSRGRGGRGKRFQNEQTLKQAIVKSLMRMSHPTSGKPYTGFVNDITVKVIKEEGYKSTSSKPTNTVRIQLYRLEEEGKVIQNDDNSYTLRKNTVREMGGDPNKPNATPTPATNS